ncbi:MAG: hypothetical protein NC089_00990, partial [Bacteroides sp.]|nr:hypothetical protein [Bacteroides sp.]MCM1549788.1 hypothetical protein [Clostridium sp.]
PYFQHPIARQLMNGMEEPDSHAEIHTETGSGSLLTRDRLSKHFYRADARHEISWRLVSSLIFSIL